MPTFELVADVEPTGDQPEAIEALVRRLEAGERENVLLGVTGSGKTFTIANVVAQVNRPTLVLAPNKTLAAQLFGEFKELFPNNAVQYFVSYYDYYQPEAYVPRTDTYIEKDSSINDDIDKMRHAATRALIEREDVLIVASVSCIYGLGAKEAYEGMLVHVEKGETIDRNKVLAKLVEIQYERNDFDFHRGVFRVRGDVVEVFPVWADDVAIRIEWFDDEIDRISHIDPLRGEILEEVTTAGIFPASHYVTPEENLKRAIEDIRVELRERIQELRAQDKLIEAQRVEQRTMFDLEMLEETGHCRGIENYSRHLTGRNPGDPPPTLLDYFPSNWLMVIDESHIAVPQVGGMFYGDRSRKQTLVDYGFRLPSALDNRPLSFDEFNERLNQVIYVSATPGDYELERTGGDVVEQIIRPTGLLDPQVVVRPVAQQVDDLLDEIRMRTDKGERVLVTTLTKKMAEDLSEYYADIGVKVRYLHSEVDTLERIEIIRDLRLGKFDVLVGINLLREGLDIPEVSLVAILDADKEGFLRSTRSLIQTIGRAARNAGGTVILYADRMTESMKAALDETERRRVTQEAYNTEHGITPATIQKQIHNILDSIYEADYVTVEVPDEDAGEEEVIPPAEIPGRIEELRAEMKQAAADLEFEHAAQLRDMIKELERRMHLEYGEIA